LPHMDYVTRQFINLTKNLRKDARRLLTDLKNALQNQTHAIREATKSSNNQRTPPPEIVTHVHFPPSIEVRQSANEAQYERRYKRRTLFISFITFLIITFYAVLVYLQLREMVATTGATQQAVVEARRNRLQSEKNLNATIEQFRLDQRAWVGLMGSNHISIQIVKGSPIKITIELQNVGKTPALSERSVNHFANRPIKDPMPNFDNCSKKDAGGPITLMPNGIASVNISTDAPGAEGIPLILTDADIDLLDRHQVELFIYGCIWYDDVFSRPHKTDYCFRYLPASTKGGGANYFVACGVHNYAD
jgi:hypothetical protein